MIDWESVKLSFPKDAPMAFIAGQWVINGNRIDTTFTREQLELCMKLCVPITMAERKQVALRLGGIHV